MDIATLDRLDRFETIASLTRAIPTPLEDLIERHAKSFVVVSNQNSVFHKYLVTMTKSVLGSGIVPSIAKDFPADRNSIQLVYAFDIIAIAGLRINSASIRF